MIEQTGNLAVEEDGRLGHDQVRLQELTVGVEVGEGKPGGGVSQRWGVPGFVLPRLEMHRLGRADAEQDAQHFSACDPLGERGVEAGAPSRSALPARGRTCRGRADHSLGGARGSGRAA